ncbi:hypothetical protein TNCV_4147461 [Trichonephila clavipes]|nr:hypothetical protein TNCV_4147461 [Trichonephila clavipes]
MMAIGNGSLKFEPWSSDEDDTSDVAPLSNYHNIPMEELRVLTDLTVVPARISSQSSRHCRRLPLPHAWALILRDFGCVLGEQKTKQLRHVAKVDLVGQLGV